MLAPPTLQNSNLNFDSELLPPADGVFWECSLLHLSDRKGGQEWNCFEGTVIE